MGTCKWGVAMAPLFPGDDPALAELALRPTGALFSMRVRVLFLFLVNYRCFAHLDPCGVNSQRRSPAAHVSVFSALRGTELAWAGRSAPWGVLRRRGGSSGPELCLPARRLTVADGQPVLECWVSRERVPLHSSRGSDSGFVCE